MHSLLVYFGSVRSGDVDDMHAQERQQPARYCQCNVHCSSGKTRDQTTNWFAMYLYPQSALRPAGWRSCMCQWFLSTMYFIEYGFSFACIRHTIHVPIRANENPYAVMRRPFNAMVDVMMASITAWERSSHYTQSLWEEPWLINSPHKRPVMQSFDVFSVVSVNELLNK